MKQIIGCLRRLAPSRGAARTARARFVFSLGVAAALTAFSGSHLSLAAASPPAAPGTIVTVAGNGQAGLTGDGGPATQAAIYYPLGLTTDTAGNLYIATSEDDTGSRGARVRRISPAGVITTVAGSGRATFSGDGGPALSAGMGAVDLRVDGAGNLYLADYNNNRVRRVDVNGIITTVAGGGNPANGIGDGGPATSARLSVPTDVALDAKGNLYIVEHTGHRIRMVAPDGTITTVAGTGKAGFSGDGGPATAAELDLPITITVDTTGHLYIADVGNHRVRMVGPDGTIHTVAGGGSPADGLGDGGPATDARLDTPTGVAVDGAGNLFIADSHNRRIRRVGPVGIISTVAGTGVGGFSGDGGPATQAELSGPFNLAMDQAGNLFFSDVGPFSLPSNLGAVSNDRIREVVGVGVPG